MKQTFDKIPDIIAKHPQNAGSLIMILQDIQKEYNYLPPEALTQTAAALDVPLSKVCSVSTFYNSFSLKPRGRKIVRVCVGTACHIRGSNLIQQQLESTLNLKAGETSKDLEYTLEAVACVGACAMAPVVIINDKYHGSLKVNKAAKLLEKK
ncbi:MAG: NADH-quinone oxidoreductase subunit NuoE [candidate division Zixibacteria bacterium]|nr:NADH-quinone oxidoreductase subunit NuoE [candidate division Zixibacteria bacterium]